jgi:hypothetical protein
MDVILGTFSLLTLPDSSRVFSCRHFKPELSESKGPVEVWISGWQ